MYMKKRIALFLTLIILVGTISSLPITVSAASISDLTFKLNDDGKSYAVTDCNDSVSGSLSIPAEYKGLPVTKIGDYAFYCCGSLVGIEIPSTVTSIGSCAFHATYINKVSIPKGVTVLEDGTFSDCYNLSSVTLPEGITSIGEYCFMSCDYLTSITLPSTLKTIGNQAFDSCTGFTTINIPDSVTHIGNRAFDGCTGLTAIEIPNSVTYIGSDAFSKCKFTTFDIPDSVKFIGYGALGSCPNLTTVTIGSGLETIEAGAFSQSVKLTAINASAENNYFSSVDGVLFNKEKTEIVQYPSGKTGSTYSIPDSVIKIRDGAFAQCSKLVSMVIPDCVIDLADSAFVNCYNLSEVTLGKGLKVLSNSVFENCKSLSAILIPERITSIDDFAFYGCTNLASINIEGEIEHLGRYAFQNTAYYNTENNWENNALYLANCLIGMDTSASGEYEIKNGTSTIGEYALSYCYEITSLKLPDTVKYICDNAFYCCEKLESVQIPKGVVSINKYAFFGCDALKTVSYNGTKTQWDSINIGAYNAPLTNADIYYEGDCIHSAGAWIVDTEATVYKAGKKHKECTKCGEILETAAIAQLKASKPKLKEISNTEYGVKITWGKVKGADSYRVYRKTSKSDWKYLGSTSKTYYTDKTAKSGKKYYYAVRARNEVGNSSLSSSRSKLYLSDPTLKTPSSTKSGVSLKWTKTTGAQGYIIYRKTGTGSYTRLKTEKGVSNLSYVDKSAKKGKKYTYKVKAYYSKTYSAYSNTKTITDKY